MDVRLFKNNIVYLIRRNEAANKVIYSTHASRGYCTFEMTVEEWDTLEIKKFDIEVTSCSKDPRAYVFDMKTSKGMEYWCAIEREGRMITLFVHEYRNRAEYEAAELNWVLYGGERPKVWDYPDPLEIENE